MPDPKFCFRRRWEKRLRNFNTNSGLALNADLFNLTIALFL